MAKVIVFSKVYPKYHPKAGERTFFVEKIWESLGDPYFDQVPGCSLVNVEPKHHTIRAGQRFKAGDIFSPRTWSDKPYRSKQIIIAPEIVIKKVWSFEIIKSGAIYVDGKYQNTSKHEMIAQNDGLDLVDFYEWFRVPCYFEGQIICWNDTINY